MTKDIVAIKQVRKFLNIEEIYEIANNYEKLTKWVADKKGELDALERGKEDELYDPALRKLTLSKYSGFLLKSRVTSDDPILKEISEEKNFGLMKNIFFPNCFKSLLEENISKEDSNKKYEKCIYKLFMLFSNGRFVEKNYNIKVLNWLADTQIEKIIRKKDQVSMVHWLAVNGNLEGVRWAFNWYSDYLRDSDIEEIFKISDKHGENIFDYITRGIIITECSELDPQPEIIELILKEFEKTIRNDEERILEVNKRKEQMSLSLQRKSFAYKLEMPFVMNTGTTTADRNYYSYLGMFNDIKLNF